MHQLRYFKHVIAMSDDIDVLWLIKCQMIFNKEVRWHEALKIYFDGQVEWLFDFLPTRKQASQYIAAELCPPFLLAQLARKYNISGAVEALENKRLKNA